MNISKKILVAYDEWNFKPQILSIFHFDRVSDGRMAHILGVKPFLSGPRIFGSHSCLYVAFFVGI